MQAQQLKLTYIGTVKWGPVAIFAGVVLAHCCASSNAGCPETTTPSFCHGQRLSNGADFSCAQQPLTILSEQVAIIAMADDDGNVSGSMVGQ